MKHFRIARKVAKWSKVGKLDFNNCKVDEKMHDRYNIGKKCCTMEFSMMHEILGKKSKLQNGWKSSWMKY